ncbi:Molybdopterin synthase sulfur carrier subunit [Dunaliella salina]|uniref:Molybdopterin synthase sulfur carrier subunit n=1 Tax=Dunaliella salina TaxID=3046 RepID=A0ABQ7G642_DUNSA|nr:Molybdopterin synthase sulfur carrier subunit [Dunaliella salina]|eukprot:KAF5830049.1 Molybdopterin synthase sulfur carrier subunit [Dunaliella salina]
MPDIKVLFFAKAREVAGLSEEAVHLQEDAAHTEALVALLVQRFPSLSSVLQTCVLAVNQEYVQLKDKVPLKQGDEVAIIPPLSGG